METIAIINQKGGVGKSTIAVNLAAGLNRIGKRTLAIDLDSQLCLTSSLQGELSNQNALSVILGETPIKAAIQETQESPLLPASRGLARAESLINAAIPTPRQPYLLKEAIEQINGEYDFIVIDTSPALNILTINSLIAANSLIIPVIADIYSLDGLKFLMETVNPIKKYNNPDLLIKGLVFTMFNSRSNLSKEVEDLTRKIALKLNTKIFKATIRQAIAVRESQAKHLSLFAYKPTAKVTEDFKELIQEVI